MPVPGPAPSLPGVPSVTPAVQSAVGASEPNPGDAGADAGLDAGVEETDAALYARVERRISRLARDMIDAFIAEVPIYGRLPREQIEGEITAITENNLRIFFRTLREGRPPGEDELADLRVSASRRAEERVPLESVLTAYHLGARMGWQALADDAQPGEERALRVGADRLLRYLQAVTAAVSTAYLEEQQSIHGEERDARRALASALLAGDSVDALAARVGVQVAPAYVVLALAIGPHVDEQDVGVAATVAARRKLRRVQERLNEFAGEPVLGLLDPTGGSALLPATPATTASVVAALPRLVAEIADVAGAEIAAAAAACVDLVTLEAAARQARDVLGLARRMGRPPGLYLIHDVLLEYQLTRDSDARPLLASLLAPLERNPDLLRTLETYLGHDLDRRGTASALHVHPNTLDYRLKRIAELTGLDPSSPTGLQLLAAGLTAGKLA